jgi:hypothetical protein
MPNVSQAQRKLMFWQKEHPGSAPRGAKHPIARAVVSEFTSSDPGGKLPAHVKNGKPVKRSFGRLA